MLIIKQWYLNKSHPNIVSGYEDEVISQYAKSDFEDVLDIIYSDEVILYNYDLSEKKTIKCIVQNNLSDTKLSSMNRKILCPIGTIKAGMYVYYHHAFWIITSIPDNNKSYEKAVMEICQYKIRWQNNKGDIIERWINAVTASKYDIGETGNKTITTASNNFTITLPYDDESLNLDGKRVFIDLHKTNPTKVYKFTRNDDLLFVYSEGYGGVLNFIVDRDELNLFTDNQELRLCDYIKPNNHTNTVINSEKSYMTKIIGSDNVRTNGNRIYKVEFKNTEIIPNYNWSVSDLRINYSISNGNLIINITDETLIGKTFEISVVIDNTTVATKELKIVESY